MLVKLIAAAHVWSLEKKRTAVAAADVATYQHCAVRCAAQDGHIFATGQNKTLKAQEKM
jgi:ABC-type transport system involved in cytochrome c biogenesis ATPase subunit